LIGVEGREGLQLDELGVEVAAVGSKLDGGFAASFISNFAAYQPEVDADEHRVRGFVRDAEIFGNGFFGALPISGLSTSWRMRALPSSVMRSTRARGKKHGVSQSANGISMPARAVISSRRREYFSSV
jgi:hypothetical protein